MTFSLVDRTSGAPLEGINVVATQFNYVIGVTGADGRCSVNIPYERNVVGPYLQFEDPDGNYMPKDTMLADLRERDILIEMNPIQ